MDKDDLIFLDNLWKKSKEENDELIQSKLNEEFPNEITRVDQIRVDQMFTLRNSQAFQNMTSSEREQAIDGINQAYEANLKPFNERKTELEGIYDSQLDQDLYEESGITREKAVLMMEFSNSSEQEPDPNDITNLEPETDSNIDKGGEETNYESISSEYSSDGLGYDFNESSSDVGQGGEDIGDERGVDTYE